MRVFQRRRSRSSTCIRDSGLGSVEGLDGLTVARLAAALDVSKSGVFAHFGSKEELQVAVIDTARDAFAKKVVGMLRETRPRVGRL